MSMAVVRRDGGRIRHAGPQLPAALPVSPGGVRGTATGGVEAARRALRGRGAVWQRTRAASGSWRCSSASSGRKQLVFNGDFHWFDADPAVFGRIQRGVLEHTALRGNVETELAAEVVEASDEDAGCGCAYPDWVGDDVGRALEPHPRRLRQAVDAGAAGGAVRACRCGCAPMSETVKLGIVHGDAQSLAGWGFAQEHLRDAAHRAEVRRWFEQAQVDAFACTHTCLPVFRSLPQCDWTGWPMDIQQWRSRHAELRRRCAQACSRGSP